MVRIYISGNMIILYRIDTFDILINDFLYTNYLLTNKMNNILDNLNII